MLLSVRFQRKDRERTRHARLSVDRSGEDTVEVRDNEFRSAHDRLAGGVHRTVRSIRIPVLAEQSDRSIGQDREDGVVQDVGDVDRVGTVVAEESVRRFHLRASCKLGVGTHLSAIVEGQLVEDRVTAVGYEQVSPTVEGNPVSPDGDLLTLGFENSDTVRILAQGTLHHDVSLVEPKPKDGTEGAVVAGADARVGQIDVPATDRNAIGHVETLGNDLRVDGFAVTHDNSQKP